MTGLRAYSGGLAHSPAPRTPRESAYLTKATSAFKVVVIARNKQPDSAASRAYYAVHNAMNGRFGAGFPVFHGEIMRRDVLEAARLDRSDATTIQDLYDSRRTADYEETLVSSREAEDSMQMARALLTKMGVDLS
jgi:hypothetical protein